MADQKGSQLPLDPTPTSADRLIEVKDPTGEPASKGLSLKVLFGSVAANVVLGAAKLLRAGANAYFTGSNVVSTANATFTRRLSANTLEVDGSSVKIKTSATPANSTDGSWKLGRVGWDSSYLYVTIADGSVKRVALSSF